MTHLLIRTASALCLTLLLAGAASAEPLPKYATPEEAMAHPIFASPGCEQGEASGCVLIVAPSDGPEGLRWIAGWAPEARTRCTDRLTAKLNLDCGADGAVRIYNIPQIALGAPGVH